MIKFILLQHHSWRKGHGYICHQNNSYVVNMLDSNALIQSTLLLFNFSPTRIYYDAHRHLTIHTLCWFQFVLPNISRQCGNFITWRHYYCECGMGKISEIKRQGLLNNYVFTNLSILCHHIMRLSIWNARLLPVKLIINPFLLTNRIQKTRRIFRNVWQRDEHVRWASLTYKSMCNNVSRVRMCLP